MIPARGRVYRADLGYGLKPFLAVSNNRRNAALDSCLAVRITTSVKPDMTSIVVLDRNDPVVGRVLCDDLVTLYRDEIRDDLGGVCARTMASVRTGLLHVLGL